MRILALIPARGGSKRLPRKNVLSLGGKPLIAWSIDIAKDIPEICDILVSTDDAEIAEISKQAGALAPWLRPAELATDTATSVDVALHALDWYEKEKGAVDGVLLLQPTSPFRSKASMIKGVELFTQSSYKAVVAVSPTHHHPEWMLTVDSCGLLHKLISGNGINTRSQDLSTPYVINGSFYLSSPESIRNEKSFLPKKTIGLLVESRVESLDIDTPFDFELAEILLKS